MPHIKRKGRSGHLENFLLSFNVISPLLLLLAVGVLLKKIKFLSPAVTRAMNKVVALVLLPVLVLKTFTAQIQATFLTGMFFFSVL